MTEAPKKSEQEKEKTAKMGEQVGRRAPTTSYRKEKELRRAKQLQRNHILLRQLNRIGENGGKKKVMKTLNRELKKMMKTVKLRGEDGEEGGEGDGEESGSEGASGIGSGSEDDNEEEEEVKVGEMMKKAKVEMEKNLNKKWWKNHGYVDTLPHVSRWDVKRVRHVVDVIKTWKVLPPRESDKTSAVKMADDALKLLMMFGSRTPSQPKSKPAEGVYSSKRKATPSAPSPLIQKGNKAKK
ncbi:hypothetical protein Scep_012065 [Stephania cephalantha]|uniref:Uncharacterized protein n=1 Tax=Stephania cephalantha TaxID=152367 RepID=A0AAP0JEQ9_9MAGN